MYCVVIPCYRARETILSVISDIGHEIDRIYVVDDACPDDTGRHVLDHCKDKRVMVLGHEVNQGVGGAVVTGIKQALEDDAEIIVKLDSDGQMDPKLIPQFIRPIQKGRADYAKGNRFYRLDFLDEMPRARLLGNAILSFVTKISSGYWNVMDPTNGYLAIQGNVARELPLHKLERRYFFESDMLFRLGTIRAVVEDVPMKAVYTNSISHLSVLGSVFEFTFRHGIRSIKRIVYNYFLRDFNIASVMLISGAPLLLFGVIFGGIKWRQSIEVSAPSSSGTVMLAALPLILGFQLLLAAVQYDINNQPRVPIQDKLK